METIWRVPADTDLGTVGGIRIVLTDPMQPWHSADNPTTYPTDGLAKQVQDILDAAAPGEWFAYLAGNMAAIVRIDFGPFTRALTPAGAHYFGIAANGQGCNGTVATQLTHGLRISPPRRAWTRLKASDPGAGLVATVLDTQTYFDLRGWLTPTEHATFAALANRPFVVGNGAAPWTELDTTGYLRLRVTDPRRLTSPRLVGTNASIVEYELETVLVR